jgi:hypothetical protein
MNIFCHPDFTVGNGISPFRPEKFRLVGYNHRSGNFALPRRIIRFAEIIALHKRFVNM